MNRISWIGSRQTVYQEGAVTGCESGCGVVSAPLSGAGACCRPGVRGACVGAARGEGPPAPPPYVHPRFHPVPTQPVFSPRVSNFSPSASPVHQSVYMEKAPVTDDSRGSRSQEEREEAYEAATAPSPEVIEELNFEGDRKREATNPKTIHREATPSSWFFVPPTSAEPQKAQPRLQSARQTRLKWVAR